MGNVKGADLGALIIEQLNSYKTFVKASVDEAAQKNAKKLQKLIKNKSPVRSGGYKKGWKVKKTSNTTFIVHNKTGWRLTHLLEFGHATKVGTGRVKAYPHIAPARDKVEKEFLEDIEKAVSGNGH